MAHQTLIMIDGEQYPTRAGLEGPFRFPSGKVLYYDPQEGSYYDAGSDYYVSNEDMMWHTCGERR